MTKAKKSLLITLFAAMMIFAIGATSAFAATTDKVEWKGKCDSLVYTNSEGVETPYTEIVKTQDSDGLWMAVVNQEKYSSLPTKVKEAKGYYWDFDGAKLGYDKYNEGSYAPAVIPTSWTRADWDTQWGKNVLEDGAFAAVAVKTEKGYAPVRYAYTEGVWYGTLKGGDDFDPANLEAQTLTLSYKTEWITGGETDGTHDNPFFFGTPDPTKVSIAKKASSAEDIALYWDEEKAGNEFYRDKYYDGAEHTVVASAVEGFTVSYQIYEEGGWKDGSVIVKDAGTDAAVTFKVVVKNAKGETVTPEALQGTWTARIYTNNPNRLAFGFVATSSKDAYYKVEGTEYDAYSWIKAYSTVGTETAPATNAAIEANNAELVAALKDVTDINAKVSKDDANIVALSVKAKSNKDLTPEDVAALDKKYATLLTNFGLQSVTSLQGRMATSAEADADFYATATVELNSTEPITKIDHIYFTEAPAKVTYKAKALKKKAKSFTVAAVADSGNAITYKMSSTSKKIKIDSATGKITVAKKTKKGTYKVKVYAQTEAGNGYAAAYTYQPMQITIKVKK